MGIPYFSKHLLRLSYAHRTLKACTKLPIKIEQLKPSKGPRLPATPVNGEEENKKKNKLKGRVVRIKKKELKGEEGKDERETKRRTEKWKGEREKIKEGWG